MIEYFSLLIIYTGDADNLKALYRRGQALLGSKKWQAASRDLERAVRLSVGDPSQQRLIRDKLQEAKDEIGIMRASGKFVETGKYRPTVGCDDCFAELGIFTDNPSQI